MRDGDAEVVVITGASAGVGRATVRKFAQSGASIALVARGREGLEAARREVEASGCRAMALSADVADENAMEDVAREVEEVLGPIDIWINNAMTSVFAPIMDVRPEEFRRVTEVTYLGQVFGTLAALKRMKPRNRGTIVLVGSALCYRGIPLQAAYCAAKHAVQGFFDSLRSELLHDRSSVHVGMVHLPALDTPHFGWVRSRMEKKPQPVPPIFDPAVAAHAIHWAAHHRRRELYVTGSTMRAIVGDKMFPALGDRFLARFGYEAQQTSEPEDQGRPDNLFEPVEGDRGARGSFTHRSLSRSPLLWLDMHRPIVLGTLGGLALGAMLLGRTARAPEISRRALIDPPPNERYIVI